MPSIGVTGGIATGKSSVSAIFHQMGAALFSADEASRAIMQPGSDTVKTIGEVFGNEYLLPDGNINRPALGERIFSDAKARTLLEKITHPRILAYLREKMDESLKEHPDRLVVVEAPLLFEAGMDEWFDYIVVVACPREVQVKRLMQRDDIDEFEANRRIDAQMPLKEKIARADFIVENGYSLEESKQQTLTILEKISPAPGR
jgi:dephospho-CoA kinase